MKVFVVFLLASFVFGGRALGRQKPDRVWILLAVCLFVSALLYTSAA